MTTGKTVETVLWMKVTQRTQGKMKIQAPIGEATLKEMIP